VKEKNKWFSGRAPPGKRIESQGFLLFFPPESLSSLLSPAKGKAVPDDDEDSYIQFEASQADTHGVQSSVIDISSSSGGKDKLQVPQPQPRKRPNSLR
jgi:hypothetical protein